jgi:translation initiation factor IF-2
MERQLIKVAKELNVGMGTVVEYLLEKGFEVENKPIAKISDSMYDTLTRKFSDSKAEKAKADLIVIGTRPLDKKPTPSVSPVVTATPVQASTPQVSTPTPTLERKTINLFAPKDAPREHVKTEQKVEEKSVIPDVIERPRFNMPKVLGKIDLNPPKKETIQTPSFKQKTDPEEREITPIKPVENIQPKSSEVKIADNKPVENRPNNQPVRQGDNRQGDNRQRDNNQRNNNNNNQRDNNREQRPKENQSSRDFINRDRPQDRHRDKPIEIPKTPLAPPPPIPDGVDLDIPNDTDLVRAEAPQLRGLKIKGKIDIDKFIEKDKTVSNNDRNRNRRDRDRDRNRNKGPRPATAAIGLVDPNAPKVQGAAGSAGSTAESEAARKRKRRRKKVPTTGTGAAGTGAAGTGTGSQNPNSGNRTGGNNSGQNTSRTSNPNAPRGGVTSTGGYNTATGGRFNPNQNQGQGGGYNTQNRTGNTGTPGEISQQQIEAKIKETMARLNMGGKNKGQKIRRDKRDVRREKQEQLQLAQDNAKLQVTEFISVSELASLIDIAPTQIITTCMNMGIFVSINQRLDAELIEVIASEFGHEVEFISAEEQVGSFMADEPDAPEDLLPRAPVVTIMGHVDHGKTSLLDNVRKANVASGEAGGITQHIGAYEVKLPDGRRVTFLDTPGHEAFTAMRARGAKVTDVAVIIIAADDSIMPQTREAISHAQAAGVPIIFAINKIDKPGAAPERIKQELAQMNLLVEEWGGKYQSQDISAKQGIGIDELIEKILLEAEILELKANPDKRASGTIIEAALDKGRGYVSKMLVQTGTMKIGDPIVAGEHAGKIKAMFNERGKKVLQAGPSTPVLVLGLSGAPQAGELFKVMPSESDAKEIATKRAQIVREQSARATKRISLDEIGRRLALGTFKELNLIIKGDVDGSVEALSDALLKQSHETVQVNVLLKAVGAIKESDVMLASASDAIIIGFQVRPTGNAKAIADREGVEIKTYSIIYEAIAEIRSAIEGMLEPTKEEKITSTIEVREVYKISKIGTVAGCYVQEGKVERKNFLRIIRDGIVVFPVKEGANGTFGSLKRFKDDVKEVKFGFEFGCTIDNYNDIEVGDFIETYEIIEVKQTLDKK